MALDVDTVEFGAFMNIPEGATSESLTAEQRSIATQIERCFRENRFLLLKNFGLSEQYLNHAFALSKQLFRVPDEHKMSHFKRFDNLSDIGYVPYGHETLNRERGADDEES